MKERGLLFQAPMVRATLDDRKTQTRRIVKPQPPCVEEVRKLSGSGFSIFTDHHAISPDEWRVAGPVWAVKQLMGLGDGSYPKWKCPYGTVGTRLWVREAWSTLSIFDSTKPSELDSRGKGNIRYHADGVRASGRYRHARFMPRWASRITLEITDIRVEQLKEISRLDAAAEGVCYLSEIGYDGKHDGQKIIQNHHWPEENYKRLFESINGKGSWDLNPWCWVISFKKVAL